MPRFPRAARPAPLIPVLALVTAAFPHPTPAATLYDPALGTLPTSQGWTYLTDPLVGATATQSLAPHGSFTGGSVTLDTFSAPGEKAGWFSAVPPFFRHPAMPVLDAETGFVLSFQMRSLGETHLSPDRAGFSLILTTGDLRGIELGFWQDEVWAQSGPDFRHAESRKFDMVNLASQFDLQVRQGRYALYMGSLTLLSGDLRRYDSFGAPYNIPNFLFLGDNTSSAGARIEMGKIVLNPHPRLTARQVAEGIELSFEYPGPPRMAWFYRDDGAGYWGSVGLVPTTNGVARLVVPMNRTAGIYRAELRN